MLGCMEQWFDSRSKGICIHSKHSTYPGIVLEYSILSVDSHTRCINSENSFLLYHATVIDLHGRIARGNKSSVSYTGKWEDRQLPWWQRLRQIMTFAHGNYSGLWVAADYAYISFYCSSHNLFDRIVVEELVIVPNCCMWQQIVLLNWSSTFLYVRLTSEGYTAAPLS